MNFTSYSPTYYQKKLASQYQSSDNMVAWFQANLNLFQDVLVCLAGFGAAFDLGQAVGPQLDVLGAIVGQSRTVGFQPTGGVSPVLDDATYRLLLQARIAQNHWDGRMDSLIDIWRSLFPGGLLIVNDHQDMTVSLYVAGAFSSIIQDLVMQGYIIPRPQAVQYAYAFATLPMLGFDRSDSYVAGLDLGHFI